MKKVKISFWKSLSPVSVIQVFWKLFVLLVKIKSILDLWSLLKHVPFLIKFVKLNRKNSSSSSSSLPGTFTSILESPKMIVFIKFASKRDTKFPGFGGQYMPKQCHIFLAIVSSEQTDSRLSISNFWVLLQMTPFLTYSIRPPPTFISVLPSSYFIPRNVKLCCWETFV